MLMTCTNSAILLKKTGTNIELGQKSRNLAKPECQNVAAMSKIIYTQLTHQNIGEG